MPDLARFAVHKLIRSKARTDDAAKATKDRLQARALIEVLEDTTKTRGDGGVA